MIQSKKFKKEKIKIIVREGEKHLWNRFKDHHYMDHTLPPSCVYYTFYWVRGNEEILIGCCGVLFQIAKFIKARRFTRVVVLPEYQGLGFGSTIINTIGRYYKDQGIEKMYITTFHPRLGEFLEQSDKWEASHNNMTEFKTNERATEGSMKGLRDGVKMYRYNFIGCSEYKLLSNPVKIIMLKTKLKKIKEEFGMNSDYEKIVKELKELSVDIKKEENVNIKSLSVDDENHIERKKLHNKMFNKSKRKVLTAEERKQLKNESKNNKR